MLFYIYAPNRSINIKFAAYQIELHKDGSADLIADMLISHNSDECITDFKIIFPEVFFDVRQNNAIVDNKNKFYEVTNTYANETKYSDIILTSFDMQQKIRKSKKNHYIRILEMRDSVYKGNYSERNILSIDKRLDPIQMQVLSTMHYTLLEYELEQPLACNNPTWIRLKFAFGSAAFNLDYARNIFLKKLTNLLTYRYQVLSPENIKKNFLKHLALFKAYASKKNNNDIFAAAIYDLIKTLEADGLISTNDHAETNTKISELNIVVLPSDVGTISNIQTFGAIKLNEYPFYENKLNAYLWRYENNSQISQKFGLHFEIHPFNKTYFFLPWIAFIATILSFIFSKFIK